MIDRAHFSPPPTSSAELIVDSSSVKRTLDMLNDRKTPVEAIMLLLHALHEDSETIQRASSKQQMTHLSNVLEKNQSQALEIIEKNVKKQLEVTNSHEHVQLGQIAGKGITALMAIFALRKVENTSAFLTGLTATGAFLSAADALIQAFSYAQRQISTNTTQTLATTIEKTFISVLNDYMNPTLSKSIVDYLDTMRSLLTTTALIASDILTGGQTQRLYRYGNHALAGIQSIQSAMLGRTENQLATITSEQQTLEAFQDMIRQLVTQQLKLCELQSETLLTYIDSLTSSLESQHSCQQRIIQNSL